MATALGSEDFRGPSHPEASHSDLSRQNQDLKKLGRSVYRQCWQEFYNWEPHGCQQFIAELSPNPLDSVSFDMYDGLLASYGFSHEHVMAFDADDDTPLCSVRVYDMQNSYSDSQLPLEEVEVANMMPYPTYESCPPSSKCMVSRNDEPTEQYETPFIPYADEEEFDAVEYQEECQWLSWQVDWRDPDCKSRYTHA